MFAGIVFGVLPALAAINAPSIIQSYEMQYYTRCGNSGWVQGPDGQWYWMGNSYCHSVFWNEAYEDWSQQDLQIAYWDVYHYCYVAPQQSCQAFQADYYAIEAIVTHIEQRLGIITGA